MDRNRQARIAGIRTPLTPPIAAPVLVGYSGGMDSTVLLHALASDPRMRAQGLQAIHVHHGLQPQADAWAAHCRDVCTAMAVPLRIEHVQVDATTGEGLEAAARRARYATFGLCMAENGILALAHHSDDQAETFLLRALRASSVDGLAAMQPWRAHRRGWLWRPLLAHAREDLRAYAQTHGLHWIEDPSNAAADARRNFLRNVVLPLLRQQWPQADAALARSAELSGQAATLLREQDLALLRQALDPDAPQRLPIAAVSAMPAAQRARVLRAWIDALHLPPLPGSGLAVIEQELLAAPADAQAAFVWRDARIVRWRGDLYALRGEPKSLPHQWSAQWDGREPLLLPSGDTLRLEGADAFDTLLHVRARRGGERIVLPGRTHSHALKHVLQERGVAPWQRAALPLLCDATGTVLAAGEILSGRLQAWLHENHARLRLLRAV